MEKNDLNKRFLIFVDKGEDCYSVYSPDVPGCFSTGQTLEAAKRNMVEALTLHLDDLHTEGDEIPENSSDCLYLEFEWTPTKLSEEQ